MRQQCRAAAMKQIVDEMKEKNKEFYEMCTVYVHSK